MRLRWVTFAVIASLAAGNGAYAAENAKKNTASRASKKKAARKGTADRLAKQPVSFDPAAVNNPGQAPVSKGDRGSAAVRAQILLDRARFSCGELDGEFGDNLEKTVAAFQGERKLPVSRSVDAATWAALNGDSAPALTEYTITAEDVKGPFVEIPKEMMDQAKLPALGYSSPLEEIAERFHASQQLMKALNPQADFGKAGQKIQAPNVLTMPPQQQAARVEVSKGESSVRAYDANGKLLAFYGATIGSEHDPLPVGTWKILGVQRNPSFHYNAELFWDAKNPTEKAVIKPGPNNPVGVVWIDLSKEHYGIHGTPDPALVGHAFSHGCIRLTNWDATDLASMVKPGTPAILKE
jgi:lipoprotein-anchoring transpeptidase ErfK/SrfK